MFVFWILLLAAWPVHAETPGYLLQADSEYSRRSNISEAKIALADFTEALREHPDSVEACWKASRAAWWLGDHAGSSKDKIDYFQKGIDFGNKGIALDPNSVESHFWLGVNYGTFGEAKGVLKSLFLVKPIRHEMAEVNRIDAKYDGGGGYRMLGIVDYQVPGFAGGNHKRALENLQKALAIDPENPFTHYYLGEYYKTRGDRDKMAAEWTALQELNVPDDLRPEYIDLLRKGKKLFES